MKINEMIKQKRQEQGLTQEQIAQSLGISAPAVNKWEKGNSFPDITLLPTLARLLKTDLNTLLSFQEDLSEEEVAMFLNTLAQTKDMDLAYDMAMKKISEFPNCPALLYGCAIMLEGVSAQYQKGDMQERVATTIESLYRRVFEGEDERLKSYAAGMLIRNHTKRKEFDQAEAILKELPEQNGLDKKQMQIELAIAYEHLEDAQKMSEERILNKANEMQTHLIKLTELAISQGRKEDAESIAEIASKFAHLFDMWEYTSYVAKFECYVKTKQKRKCLGVLIPMLKSIKKPWNINQSPLYRSIKTKGIDTTFPKEMQSKLLQSMREDEEMDFLKDEVDFQKMEQQL